MRAVDIIIKKRDRQELNREEIKFFVEGFTEGSIPDYQLAAWAMAVLLNGMTPQETAFLTMAMANSGDILDLSGIVPIAVDKHSTGGVGDKTSLVSAPVVAACGLAVGKMSGRGLGFSGGTLDKLDSIPNFRSNLSDAEFKQQLEEIGIVITGQTSELAPADGKLYALRDVTGTVPSIPLIASSVMCKKIAGGADGIVLDVKTGKGAFMETLADARELSQLMVSIGKLSGRKVVALLSDMNQPLGKAVGNALELKEAVETLQNNGPDDFKEHCLVVSSHMLVLGEKAPDLDSARKMAEEALNNGSAWEKFLQFVEHQFGDISVVKNTSNLPKAKIIETTYAEKAGYLSEINARIIGEAAVDLGAGRAKKGDDVDLAVGFIIHHNVGDRVEEGEALFSIHADDQQKYLEARQRLLTAHKIVLEPCEPLPLFYDVIS